jgi:hypothetical protein
MVYASACNLQLRRYGYKLEIYFLSGIRNLYWPTISYTVFAGIMGSNPTRGMNVCVRLFYVYIVLCVGSGLATG